MCSAFANALHRLVNNPTFYKICQLITCGFIVAGVMRHWNGS